MLKLPPPVWAALILTALYFLSDLPPLDVLAHFGSGPIGLGLILFGVSLPVIAVAHFRAVGTQVMPTSERNDRLVTTGLYAFTRNPMYLGLVIAALGVALWFGRPLMYLAPILVFLIANFVFAPYEEAKMRRQFGEAFDAYAARVRRWL